MEKDLLAQLDVRDGNLSDHPFIFKTWLMGLRYGNDTFGFMEKRAYFDTYHKVIEKLLSWPKTEVKVACLKEDPTVILGYMVFDDKKIHWAFTKPVWRKFGIAKLLAPKDFKEVSHITTVGKSILKQYPEVTFNPF